MKTKSKIAILFVLVALSFFVIITHCGIFNPGADCDMVGGNGMPPIKCSGSYTKDISNIQYDPSSRVASYDYSITCGGEKYSGHVDNTAKTITVNGTKCTF